jgi:hypothetical protein
MYTSSLYFNEEVFEDTKGVIRIRISKNRQYNGKKKKYKDKQRSTKHTHKTKNYSAEGSTGEKLDSFYIVWYDQSLP